MDTDLLKSIGPLVGGILALAGGVFTFVNGRLRDAETPEQKATLLRNTGEWVALAPTFVGLLMLFLGAKFYVAVALFTLSYALQSRLFILKQSPVQRVELFTFSLLTAVTAASVVFAVGGYFLEQIISVQGRTIELLQGQSSRK